MSPTTFLCWAVGVIYKKKLSIIVSNADAEDIFYPSKQHKKTIACGIFSIICSMVSIGIT